MSIVDKIKSLATSNRKDAAEWDANDPAGDPSAYDKDYAAEVEYDHSQFEKGAK